MSVLSKESASVDNKKTVTIVNGIGNDAVPYDWKEGDTVQTVLDRAGIKLESGMAVTLGHTNVKKIATTKVKPGNRLVITRKVSNGR